MMEKIFPGTRTKMKILEVICSSDSRLNLTALIKKAHTSPNLVLNYVNILLKYDIIKEERLGGEKKTHIRIIKPNFDNETARYVYSLVELYKQNLFFEKYKSLKPGIIELAGLLKKYGSFALLYGSFARFAAETDSDIDIIIVARVKKEDIIKIREIFITQDNELSLKIETLDKFISNKSKPLYQSILREHIVICGAYNLIETLSQLIK